MVQLYLQTYYFKSYEWITFVAKDEDELKAYLDGIDSCQFENYQDYLDRFVDCGLDYGDILEYERGQKCCTTWSEDDSMIRTFFEIGEDEQIEYVILPNYN